MLENVAVRKFMIFASKNLEKALAVRLPHLLLACSLCFAQTSTQAQISPPGNYVIGPDDELTFKVMDADELSNTPFRVDSSGNIYLPLVGQVHCAGLTVQEVDDKVSDELKRYIRNPQVAARVTEMRSRPVSVLGAVKDPGVRQLQHDTTLLEMLSQAGGLTPDAGTVVRLTRRLEWGRIPLPNAADDPTGSFSTAEISVRDIMSRNADGNVRLRPNDVIVVPRAETVYVLGEVKKAGGFPLSERQQMSVLQALSLAEGLTVRAAPKSAKILRVNPGSNTRAEVPVDLPRILEGKQKDVAMQSGDILFVPNSATKSATLRGLEAAVQIGTGVAIWR